MKSLDRLLNSRGINQSLKYSCISIVCELCSNIVFQWKDISEALPYILNILIEVTSLVLRVRTFHRLTISGINDLLKSSYLNFGAELLRDPLAV